MGLARIQIPRSAMIIETKPTEAKNSELTWNGGIFFVLMYVSVEVDVVACW